MDKKERNFSKKNIEEKKEMINLSGCTVIASNNAIKDIIQKMKNIDLKLSVCL